MRNGIILVSALLGVGVFSFFVQGCGDGSSGTGGNGGGDGGSGGAGGGGVTADAACASLASAACGWIEQCAPFVLQTSYGDKSTCEARVAVRCHDPLDVSGSNATPADIQACASAYGAASCEEILAGTPEACRFPGDKDDGATCAAGAQCKGLICDSDKEGSCGVCKSIVAAGGSCDPADDRCDTGLYCNGTSSQCEARGAKGESCDAEKPCQVAYYCGGGVCSSLLPANADCAGGGVCDFLKGLFCSPTSNKCEAIVVAKAGESCGYDAMAGTLTGCEAGAECDGTVCVALVDEGGACTVDSMTGSGNCIVGYDCVGGTCTAGLPTCD